MELFDKLYNCYYTAARHILEAAASRPVGRQEMEHLCRSHGFQETFLSLIPKLTGGPVPLLKKEKDGFRSVLASPPPKLPLTSLQKAWLRALLEDSRFALFFDDDEIALLRQSLSGVEPLYREEDFRYFDRFADGDPYEDPGYRSRFHTILTALEEGQVLLISYEGKGGRIRHFEIFPCQIQFSSKNDKLRLLGLARFRGFFSRKSVLNVSRVRDCRLSSERPAVSPGRFRFRPVKRAKEPVLLSIGGERNSLERCMLHFANYEKHTEYDEEQGRWLCSIYYDTADETELLIDILSFGPVVEVLGPEPFLAQVRGRVCRQHQLLWGNLESTPPSQSGPG